MVYNVKTVPKIKLKNTVFNNAEIEFMGSLYLLYRNGRQESILNIDTNREVKEVYSSYDLAHGDVLISGLGFGILALWLANKPTVKTVKIIEISQDIVDLFLENNKLPDNVSIEIGDIEEYKTNDKYDCILLDHYEVNSVNHRINSIKNIAKNIPNHELIWIWSMEDVYLKSCYGIWAKTESDGIMVEKDFSEKWDYFKNEIMKVKTVPDLTKDKVNEYIYTFVDFLNSKYVLFKNKK